MKKLLVALLCMWCSAALAQTAQELIDNGKNSENVTTFGMLVIDVATDQRESDEPGRRSAAAP